LISENCLGDKINCHNKSRIVKVNTVSFAVKDTGQGIAPQYKDKIYNRYFRIPGNQKQGTGLGLAISKEFMQAQGGQISMKSDYGTGSKFTISLPLYQIK